MDRLTNYIEDLYLTRGLFKWTEQEAYRVLLQITPLNFEILHILGHQYEQNNNEELETPARLNIKADTLVITHSTTPVNTHIISTPFVIYVNEKYIPYKFEREI